MTKHDQQQCQERASTTISWMPSRIVRVESTIVLIVHSLGERLRELPHQRR